LENRICLLPLQPRIAFTGVFIYFKTNTMKKGIHPDNYRVVAFKDMSNDHVFLCRSAVQTKETIEVDGETYPVYKMEISNTSHPFYTGKMKLVDTAGRVDKFMSRYQKHYDKKAANK
jgi:large subunit ribosomal protein L31